MRPAPDNHLENQVTAIAIQTPDGETLYAWHILPRALYAKHESELIELVPYESKDFTEIKDFKETLAFKLLTNDANSKLIINCKSLVCKNTAFKLTLAAP